MIATNRAAPCGGRSQTTSALSLGLFTEARLLVPRLLSAGPDGVIQELAKRFEATGRIPDAAAFTEVVVRREMDIPTFAGGGVMVPHGRGGAVRSLSLAVGLSECGIPWGRDRGLTARAIFLFAIPLTKASTYLALLSGLSTLMRDETAFASLTTATQPEDMLRVLTAVSWVRRTFRMPPPPRP
jgi:mannitol/fructose-specific phosphotransferase system IIA component (Ntr-type)